MFLSAVLLNDALGAKKSAKLDTAPQAVNHNLGFSPGYSDSFRWVSSLDRALDFPKYNYKVPDYLPEGYQFENIVYDKNFSKPNDVDLIDVASISFVANFGTENERRIEVKASKGNDNLLEHNQLRGANDTSELLRLVMSKALYSRIKDVINKDQKRAKVFTGRMTVLGTQSIIITSISSKKSSQKW